MNDSRLNKLLELYDVDNHDSFVLFAIAKEYEYLEKLEYAINSFESLKSVDANYVGLYFHLAALYQKVDNFEAAMQTYDEGIAIAKKLPDFHALSELVNAKQNLELEL